MRKLGLSIVLAVLVYGVFAALTDVRALGSALTSIDPRAVVIALALSTANYLVRFGRWSLYLRKLGVRVAWRPSLTVFVAGLLMSITPGKLGEAWKSLLLKESTGVPVIRTAGIVVAERVTDLLALLALMSLAAFRSVDLRLALLALALTLGVCAFFALTALSSPVVAALRRLERDALAERVERFFTSTGELLGPSLLVQGTLIACAAWALEAEGLSILADGLGLELPRSDAFFIYATATLAGGLAMLPGGLGVTEGSMAALIGRALPGATAPDRMALTLFSRCTTLWWGVLLGACANLLHVHARRRHRNAVDTGPSRLP